MKVLCLHPMQPLRTVRTIFIFLIARSMDKAQGWMFPVCLLQSVINRKVHSQILGAHDIEGPDHIDPTCFIDEDGEAYLYWGFGRPGTPYIAKLKENMRELAEEPIAVDYGSNDFFEASRFYTNIKARIILHITSMEQVMRVMLWKQEERRAILHMDRLLTRELLAKAPSGAQSHPGIIQYKDD